MMLLLKEESYKSLPESKRVLYLLQWLQNLPQAIRSTDKSELKASHKALLTQLLAQLVSAPGPPLRSCLVTAFVALYEVGDTLTLHGTISRCCDVARTKEEKDSPAALAVNKLTAIECLGGLFQHHGRMAGSSFPETVQVLVKTMRTPEYRPEALTALHCILIGLGPSSSSTHKDIYKCIKAGLGDKAMAVRSAAAKCALELSSLSPPLYSSELDSLANSCLKAFEGSNYDVRCAVGRLLGSLIALTQKPLPKNLKGKLKLPSLDDALSILSNGFVRGAGGFLKAGGPELLKGGGASREVRVGVTQAYVVFLREMGGVWLERNLATLARRILELVTHSKATATHIDAVYSRRCASFILRIAFGTLLGESAQFVAARQLCEIVSQSSSTLLQKRVRLMEEERVGEAAAVASEREEREEREGGKERMATQHMMICALLEIGALVYGLNTAALPLLVGDAGPGVALAPSGGKQPPLLEALSRVLLHPALAARLAGAWCMHCMSLALPSQLSALVSYCLAQLRQRTGSLDAVSGYSHTIAALLRTVKRSELGIPSAKAKEVVSLAQELLAAGRERNVVNHVQSGWALISAFVSLGPTYIQAQLPSLVALWRSTFPHSKREVSEEQEGGSAASWATTLANRTGALISIASFLKFCSELVTGDTAQRLMLPLDSALAMLQGLPALSKTHGMLLKAAGAMLRLRLYQSLVLLPPSTYEGSLSSLLRELVTEFTLADNLASTTTSLLRSMCHHDDSVLLGSWLEETDQRAVEEQLQPNSAAGSGALEHDPSSVFMADVKDTTLPGPLPLGVAVIDTAIALFGRAFPTVAQKHRLQLLDHFRECIRQAKSGRQQAIQINIFTAFLSALKNLVETKSVLGTQELLSSAYGLIASAITNPEPMLRCAAGEALGRMSQVGGDSSFVAQVVQASFDTLRSTRDPFAQSGHCLALGCLHRYVGGMGSGQHLQTSVSVLHSLSQDAATPSVQVWALHALALVADSGGPMFRSYVEPTLSLVLRLMVSVPTSQLEVHQCLGKCLSALITTLGPELQDTSPGMTATRATCLTCCTMIQHHPDAIVQSAAIACLQRLQVFAPLYVDLGSVVPRLCTDLDSPHLLLRRAAANCLRQFTQREPKTVWTICLQALGGESEETEGLERLVLAKLDAESDPKLREDLREVLFSLLTSLAPEDPTKWLLFCNNVLSASEQGSAGREGEPPSLVGAGRPEGDEDEDMAKFTMGEEPQPLTKISPRWPTKVFAVECSRKIYAVCRSDPAHFDLVLAMRRTRTKEGGYLVMHLSELVRTSFIAATASVDQLKLAGYEALRDVIKLFAATPDPDFPGHVLLEQYQAQIGAALRPAFTSDTAPHVTAMACQVCSEWLGSGVSRDVSDLKRVQQLLVSSLEKLRSGQQEGSLFGEAVATMQSLAVLKAWAELYIKVSEDVAREEEEGEGGGGGGGGGKGGGNEGDSQSSAAMSLLDPHLPSLSRHWLAALKDHAYLSLPSQYANQLPPSGGTFYRAEVADHVVPYFESNWSSLLQAAAIWLVSEGLGSTGRPIGVPVSSHARLDSATQLEYFHLVLGLAIKALCSPATLDQPHTVLNCLEAVRWFLRAPFSVKELGRDTQLSVELLSVFHRLLLTLRSRSTHVLVLSIAVSLSRALRDSRQHDPAGDARNLAAISAGFRLETAIEPGKSCVYGLLEVAACCLLRMVPGLRPVQDGEDVNTSAGSVQHAPSSPEEPHILSQCCSLLVTATQLCSVEAVVKILPTALHMLLSTLAYFSTLPPPPSSPSPTSSILHSLDRLATSLPLTDHSQGGTILGVLRAALASLVGGKSQQRGAKLEAEGCVGMEQATKLLAVTLLLKSSPAICPPSSLLFTECVALLRDCLKAGDSKLQLKGLQSCWTIFLCRDDNNGNAHFIHTLGPEVVRLVEEGVSGGVRDADVIVQAMQVLEALLDLTPDENRTKMMGLVVPLLVSALVAPSPPPSKQQRALHVHALHRLKLIGPKYPSHFKTVMQRSPSAKQKLEGAIRAGQLLAGGGQGGKKAAASAAMQAPAIKLKMDFSNFK